MTKRDKKELFCGPSSPAFHGYLVMFFAAWVCGFILELCLFLRSGPYGQPYVLDIWHYLPHAIFYMTFGLALIACPWMIAQFFFKTSEKRPIHTRIGQTACAILLALSLLYQHIDNEVLRFCSMHITPDFLRTYVLSQGVPQSLWNLLAEDAGGANVSLIMLGVPVLFLLFWFILGVRIPRPRWEKRLVQWGITGVLCIAFVGLPFLFRTNLFGSKNRQAKVAPPAVLIANAISSWNNTHEFPDDMPQRLAAVHAELAARHDGWTYPDPAHPFYREYAGECPKPDKPYNVILIALESFRAYSIDFLNPAQTLDTTPFIKSLAMDPHSAYWTRYYTNGHPTIGGFMALHTSLLPHSSRTVAKAFTHTRLDSFVSVAQRHGYETIFLGASDPDWDNQRPWLVQWYDHILFDRNLEALGDRSVLQNAADFLKTKRNPDKPFVFTTLLISNHMPFHVLEEDLRLTQSTALPEAIFNTMHYDDDAVREFVTSIQNEPWYKDTILIVTADHGLDLGDQGESPDYNNLRPTATWIPLVIHVPEGFSRLQAGPHDRLASHIDLGPTVMDMLGFCDANAFMGYSLLRDPSSTPMAFKENRAMIYTPEGAAYILEDDKAMLFAPDDIRAEHDIADQHPALAQKLTSRARNLSLVVDYVYQNGLFYPNAPVAP